MGPSPAIPAGYTFSNSFNFSYMIIYSFISCYSCRLHLLNFSKFSSGYFLQGLFPKRGSQTSQVGLLFNISNQYDFYPITECEQCALGAYLGQGGARLLSRTGQTANSADIRCGIQFAKAMWQKNAAVKTMAFWNFPLIVYFGIQYFLHKYRHPKWS